MKGNWALVRLRRRSKKDKDNWLLIKEKDDVARTEGKLTVDRETESVATGRDMDEIAGGKRVWHSNRPKKETDRLVKKKTRNFLH